MKNLPLQDTTTVDIDGQIAKILRGLGDPEPPLDLRMVRELLNLDKGYYSTTDDSLLRETFSKLKIAGIQVLRRPTLLRDAVFKLSLKALYIPDQKRILIDSDLPKIKHRWNEAHEIGHEIIPWHRGMMHGDTELTLTRDCHAVIEAEANHAAGQLLFMSTRFSTEATSSIPSMNLVKGLSKTFGNTITATLWRLVEFGHGGRPMVALVTGHPHVAKRRSDFDGCSPCRYCIESPPFRARFGALTEVTLFEMVAGYAGPQKGGTLGSAEIVLPDNNGDPHIFHFETFFNGHEALSLGYWLRERNVRVAI